MKAKEMKMMMSSFSKVAFVVFIVVVSSSILPSATAKLRGDVVSNRQDVVEEVGNNRRVLKDKGEGKKRSGSRMMGSSSESSSEEEDTMPLTTIRSIEGKENALAGLEAELQRFSDPDFPDGKGVGTSMRTEPDLPNPRFISNVVASVHDDIEPSPVTDALWQWGQFIDHDIGLTEGIGEEANILWPDDDLITTIPFNRAVSHYDSSGVRQQLNEITGFLDASQVYGYTDERAEFLRELKGGRMKMQSEYKLLPFAKDGGSHFPNANGGKSNIDDELFIAGDPRANEQIGLISMHTLWVREHNRIADILSEAYSGEDDEIIYQMTRKLVTAEINHITYTQFLPLLIGNYAPNPSDAEFDSDVNPGVAQEFSAMAFRVGHSFLSEKMMIHNGAGPTSYENLEDAFFCPGKILEFPGMIDGIVIGQTSKPSERPDIFVVDAVRNKLFGPAVAGTGFDLVALNIARGRDHGLPRYNEIREAYGLTRKSTFRDVSSSEIVRERLEMAYDGDIDKCDGWVCGIAEDAAGGGLLGELFSTIISDQFTRFMNGDEFFYTQDPDVDNDELKKKTKIKVFKTTYADIINKNTIGGVKGNAFVAPQNTMR